jgi:mannosyl-oligosaccharide alpha-1,2-mannosidase
MESIFYAYRTTGDTIWQDRAWEAFQHITTVTQAPLGYSSVADVMKDNGGEQLNEQQSFWLAETLKYLYLIFDDPSIISLDEWVFNTECHPLRRGRLVNWNSTIAGKRSASPLKSRL